MRRRRVDLSRDELLAVGDWHIAQAEHYEGSADEFAASPERAAWRQKARQHRRRADSLFGLAAALPGSRRVPETAEVFSGGAARDGTGGQGK